MDGIHRTFDPRTIEVEPLPNAPLPTAIEGVSGLRDTGVELHLDPTPMPTT